MSDNPNLVISFADTNNVVTQKTISNINPDASNGNCKSFAETLKNLTNSTLKSVTKVARTDVSDVIDRAPYLKINPSSVNAIKELNNGKYSYIVLSYKGDVRTPTWTGKKPSGSTISVSGKTITIKGTDGSYMGGSETATLTITLPGNSTYDEAGVTFTFVNLDEEEIVDA